MSKYGVFSGPYFPAFGLNREMYRVNLRVQLNAGKYGPKKTPYLDTFQAVMGTYSASSKTLELTTDTSNTLYSTLKRIAKLTECILTKTMYVLTVEFQGYRIAHEFGIPGVPKKRPAKSLFSYITLL